MELLDRFKAWALDILEFSLGFFPTEYARIQALLMTLLLASIAVWILALTLRRKRTLRPASPVPAAGLGRIAPSNLEDPSDRLAAGDAPGAVRAAFLLVLSALAGRVPGDLRVLTPREIRRKVEALGLPPAFREGVGRAAIGYARIRYGGEGISLEEARAYSEAAREAVRLLEARHLETPPAAA